MIPLLVLTYLYVFLLPAFKKPIKDNKLVTIRRNATTIYIVCFSEYKDNGLFDITSTFVNIFFVVRTGFEPVRDSEPLLPLDVPPSLFQLASTNSAT